MLSSYYFDLILTRSGQALSTPPLRRGWEKGLDYDRTCHKVKLVLQGVMFEYMLVSETGVRCSLKLT